MFAVADGDLDAGTALDDSNTRFVAMELADEVASGAFTDVAQLRGRRLLAPLFDGDLLQASGVSDEGRDEASYEVSFSVPGAYAVNGLVRRGDLVDMYVTEGETTRLVARRAEVVQAPAAASSGFGARGGQVIVLRLPSADEVAAVVHASRSGDVTLARSTFADPDDRPAPRATDSGNSAVETAAG
jgi:hypothetical protein